MRTFQEASTTYGEATHTLREHDDTLSGRGARSRLRDSRSRNVNHVQRTRRRFPERGSRTANVNRSRPRPFAHQAEQVHPGRPDPGALLAGQAEPGSFRTHPTLPATWTVFAILSKEGRICSAERMRDRVSGVIPAVGEVRLLPVSVSNRNVKISLERQVGG